MGRFLSCFLFAFGVCAPTVWPAHAEDAGPTGATKQPADKMPDGAKQVTRLILQDQHDCTVRWLDVYSTKDGKTGYTKPVLVGQFPALDPKRQKLVQMRESGGVIVVGVRDENKGAYGSGYIVIDSGVGKSDHGDHHHWSYQQPPVVIDQAVDGDQGNPAHVYRYNGKIFVANDLNNGYTRIDPSKYRTEDGRSLGKDKPRFLKGGGNHITLAVHEDTVGYSAWVDGGGPNKGRIDVTPVGITNKAEPAYTFHLPHGGIHGAAACCGKVFFAPSDGICWVLADPSLSQRGKKVEINHISLGKDGDKPARTGAFATAKKHVLFTAGKGASTRLAIIHAESNKPTLTATLDLGLANGYQALTPEVFIGADESSWAFVFHDRASGVAPGDKSQSDKLQAIELDPDGNGCFKDARLAWSIDVGPSRVEGHYGHHSISFDEDGRYAFIANPGDGTIQALSLSNLKNKPFVAWTLQAGGSPHHVMAIGGQEFEE
jgi:hypothetical protein